MERFDEILATMDVPENRKHDWMWLSRNLGIRNSKHSDFQEAFKFVVEMRKKLQAKWLLQDKNKE